MEAVWTGDFHYQMPISRSKVWSQGFGQCVVPSGGAGSQHHVASIVIQTSDQDSVHFWCCRQRTGSLGWLLSQGFKYRVWSRSPRTCPQAWDKGRLAARCLYLRPSARWSWALFILHDYGEIREWIPQIWTVIICHKMWKVLKKRIKQKLQEPWKEENTWYLGIWEGFMENRASESLPVCERLMKEGKVHRSQSLKWN